MKKKALVFSILTLLLIAVMVPNAFAQENEQIPQTQQEAWKEYYKQMQEMQEQYLEQQNQNNVPPYAYAPCHGYGMGYMMGTPYMPQYQN